MFFSSVFDMVNVHLFHDASNLLAAAQSPSVYSEFRKNALQYTLKKYEHVSMPIIDAFLCSSLPLDPAEGSVPFAIFGDFNFRLDAHRLLEVKPTLDRTRAQRCLSFHSILPRNAVVLSTKSSNRTVTKFARLSSGTLRTPPN